MRNDLDFLDYCISFFAICCGIAVLIATLGLVYSVRVELQVQKEETAIKASYQKAYEEKERRIAEEKRKIDEHNKEIKEKGVDTIPFIIRLR